MTPHAAHHLTTIPDLAELNAECRHAPPKFEPPHPCAIVYGKGELGRMAIGYLETTGQAAIKWIDQIDLTDDAFPILSPGDRIAQQAKPQRFLILVAVAKHPYVPIEQDLMAHGFRYVAPFLDVTPNHPEHPLANGWFADPLDLDKVQAVLDMFEDDVSRKHYVQFLAWRRLREEWTFEGAPVDVEGPRYWPPEVASVLNQGHEVFIDGGSYDGKVSEQFLYRFGGKTVTIDVEGQPDFKVALGSTDDGDTLFHKGFGYASRVWRRGDSASSVATARTWSVDGLMAAQRPSYGGPLLIPTFIKLHLEGHELPALEGAARTIEVHRPILAVTTYHNDDGMDRIPLWLRDHCPGYRFLWRNSAYVGEGAVMFGVPKERDSA